MFFGRIYSKGRVFVPTWRSYAAYVSIVALILLAIEFNVLNVLPGNKIGNVLLFIPVFYFILSVVFLLNDLCIELWRRFRGRPNAKATRKRKAPARASKAG
jgi:hypothetical protein